MRREWSFHRSGGVKKYLGWLIAAGVLLFILGFFSARPIMTLLGFI